MIYRIVRLRAVFVRRRGWPTGVPFQRD